MHEINRRDTIDAKRQVVAQRDHMMDVGEAEQAELRQHQDADSGAEVSAIDRHQELKEKRGTPSAAIDRMATRRIDDFVHSNFAAPRA